MPTTAKNRGLLYFLAFRTRNTFNEYEMIRHASWKLDQYFLGGDEYQISSTFQIISHVFAALIPTYPYFPVSDSYVRYSPFTFLLNIV